MHKTTAKLLVITPFEITTVKTETKRRRKTSRDFQTSVEHLMFR